MNLSALIFLPVAAWHLYRVVRGLRSGVFESLGPPVDRGSLAAFYWFRVARELLLGILFAALCVSVLLGLDGVAHAWLFGSYVAVYLALLVATVSGAGKRSNRPLERTGSAGRSTPSR